MVRELGLHAYEYKPYTATYCLGYKPYGRMAGGF